MQTSADGWAVRRRKVADKVDSTLAEYRKSRDGARRAHNALSLMVIVGAVLAPVLTTLSVKEPPYVGIAVQVLSILVGLMIAVSEALRRLWRPETRWKATAIAIQEIVAAREAFRDAEVPLEIGSSEWVAAFTDFRRKFEAVLKQETADYFPAEPDKGPSGR